MINKYQKIEMKKLKAINSVKLDKVHKIIWIHKILHMVIN